MKVVVHCDHCIASGACVVECPEVFNQDQTGLVIVLQDEPEAHLQDAVRRAAAACPAAVIELSE